MWFECHSSFFSSHKNMWFILPRIVSQHREIAANVSITFGMHTFFQSCGSFFQIWRLGFERKVNHQMQDYISSIWAGYTYLLWLAGDKCRSKMILKGPSLLVWP